MQQAALGRLACSAELLHVQARRCGPHLDLVIGPSFVVSHSLAGPFQSGRGVVGQGLRLAFSTLLAPRAAGLVAAWQAPTGRSPHGLTAALRCCKKRRRKQTPPLRAPPRTRPRRPAPPRRTARGGLTRSRGSLTQWCVTRTRHAAVDNGASVRSARSRTLHPAPRRCVLMSLTRRMHRIVVRRRRQRRRAMRRQRRPCCLR